MLTRSVKHLNPRQGITTAVNVSGKTVFLMLFGVKHLNPRQGITTRRARSGGAGGGDGV